MEPTEQPTPCVVCKRLLEPVFPGRPVTDDGYVQPAMANTLSTSGTYGSTVFDPCDGSTVEVNICDLCLVHALDEGRAKKQPPC